MRKLIANVLRKIADYIEYAGATKPILGKYRTLAQMERSVPSLPKVSSKTTEEDWRKAGFRVVDGKYWQSFERPFVHSTVDNPQPGLL